MFFLSAAKSSRLADAKALIVASVHTYRRCQKNVVSVAPLKAEDLLQDTIPGDEQVSHCSSCVCTEFLLRFSWPK